MYKYSGYVMCKTTFEKKSFCIIYHFTLYCMYNYLGDIMYGKILKYLVLAITFVSLNIEGAHAMRDRFGNQQNNQQEDRLVNNAIAPAADRSNQYLSGSIATFVGAVYFFYNELIPVAPNTLTMSTAKASLGFALMTISCALLFKAADNSEGLMDEATRKYAKVVGLTGEAFFGGFTCKTIYEALSYWLKSHS